MVTSLVMCIGKDKNVVKLGFWYSTDKLLRCLSEITRSVIFLTQAAEVVFKIFNNRYSIGQLLNRMESAEMLKHGSEGLLNRALVTDCEELWGFWTGRDDMSGHLCISAFTNFFESISQYHHNTYGYYQ